MKQKWVANQPKYINAERIEWRNHTSRASALAVMRYLHSEAGSRLSQLKNSKKKGYISSFEDIDWAVLDCSNRDIFNSLKAHKIVSWENYFGSRTTIVRALIELEGAGLIAIHMPAKTKRLIGVLSHFDNEPGGNDPDSASSKLVANMKQTSSKLVANMKHFVSSLLLVGGEDTAINKDGIEAAGGSLQYNIKEYKQSGVLPEAKAISESIIIENVNEVNTKPSQLTPANNYCLVNKDKSLVKSWEMTRDTEPRQWPDEYIKKLEEFVNYQTQRWGFKGGYDNERLNLALWLNNPAHKELVAPWLHESIHYTDFRDLPNTTSPKTFTDFDWSPMSTERINRILAPTKEETREAADRFSWMYAQPFNNPYLSPEQKGLAFIRLFPFGFSARDAWIHPWSPPLIPWAVVADNKELLDKWNKMFWFSGFHPFQPDSTTAKIRKAIALGNREVPEDPFFDKSRADKIDQLPNTGGMCPSIVVDPGPFQLLNWLCGTIGVSPTVMIDAYKRFETYRGELSGLNLQHPSNVNADKIRMFANYLKTFMVGSKKEGSWLPREQGINKSLASAENQEWFHQGVLGGASVLVRCWDGNMREVWMTPYQKAIYDLKFNPKSPKDKEILDSLLAELL